MDTIRTRQNYGVVERSRALVLTAGYQFIGWKTKFKKKLINLINSIVRFYF